MRNEPMRRNELPETCFSILPSSGQLIIIRCGERGYYWEKAAWQYRPLAVCSVSDRHAIRVSLSAGFCRNRVGEGQ